MPVCKKFSFLVLFTQLLKITLAATDMFLLTKNLLLYIIYNRDLSTEIYQHFPGLYSVTKAKLTLKGMVSQQEFSYIEV